MAQRISGRFIHFHVVDAHVGAPLLETAPVLLGYFDDVRQAEADAAQRAAARSMTPLGGGGWQDRETGRHWLTVQTCVDGSVCGLAL